jgi:low temperature requirement protein LtrA
VTGPRRTALALNALFYGNIPVLLGLVAMAAGVQEAIAASAEPVAGHPAAATALAVGAALFLAGDAAIRRTLGIGSSSARLGGGLAALATIPAGALGSLNLQLALLTAVLSAALVVEYLRDTRRPPAATSQEEWSP